MTSRDGALLLPAAVAHAEARARRAWALCGIGVTLLVWLLGLAHGWVWPAVLLAVVLAVAVMIALFGAAWALHRRNRLLLESFLRDLDPLGPTADRP